MRNAETKTPNINPRFSMLGIVRGLMLSENLGDVHDEINHLHDLLGFPRPTGNFLEGWTPEDFKTLNYDLET